MKITPATTADCATIRAIAEQTFPLTYVEILTPEQIDYMMDWMYSLPNIEQQMRDGHHFLLAADAEPCGYVSFNREADGVWHIQKLYVLPSQQGSGLGRTLFEAAVSEIRRLDSDAREVRLNVNRHNRALGFYERLGMRIADSGDFDIGDGYYMNDYIMSLALE